MSDINDLIQHAMDQDFNKANQVFGDLMGNKISDALEQEKASIASVLYNDDIEVEEDEFDDDDDIELSDEDIDELIDNEDFDEDE